MATLKNNFNKITDDTESLAKDYLKLFSIRQVEKIALFFGILTSIFVLATLLIVLIVFISFALADVFNKLLPGDFWGFLIVGSLYLLVVILLLVKIYRSQAPLFSNLFVMLIGAVLNVDSDQAKSLKGLKKEQELIKDKIETGKTKVEADFQILKYNFMGSIFKEILGIFSSRKKTKAEPVKEKEQEDESTDHKKT